MGFIRKIKKTLTIGRLYGFGGLRGLFWVKLLRWREDSVYRRWIVKFDTLDETRRNSIRAEIQSFSKQPLISVILPVYDVDDVWLRKCIESVQNQLYENWELCIADDCSPSPHIRATLEEYRQAESRIKVVHREENGHISAASNSALELTTGEFCVLLDHDDELNEQALFYVAKENNEYPSSKMIYSDEDLIDTEGRRYGPKFKPDWSRDLFYSANLITHLSCYETALLKRIGGFRVGMEGSQDYDLALRVIEEIDDFQIRHIPKVLYHWRVIETSVAASGDAKPYAHQAARDAIGAHLERTGKSAKVSETVHRLHRVRYDIPEPAPKVSIVVRANLEPQENEEYLKSLISNTQYIPKEVIVVGKGTGPGKSDATEAYFRSKMGWDCDVSFVKASDQRSAQIYNIGSENASGEIVCFLNAGLRPIGIDWLAELVSFAIQQEVGAVAGKSVLTDGTIADGGLLIGVGGTVSVSHRGWPDMADGNITRLKLIGNYSAVSVSGMAVRKKLFDKVGGFDSKHFPNDYFDADFCLRLREKGYRIVWTPHAELLRTQTKEARPQNEQSQEALFFEKKWRSVVDRDPFYNPNLRKDKGDFRIDLG
ncbi:MAG: glycosyltransferase [Pyrinomonadaceae bacterium]|nr:glycosyltransferase [Pyrinomonadaceae bacterium]